MPPSIKVSYIIPLMRKGCTWGDLSRAFGLSTPEMRKLMFRVAYALRDEAP